MTNSYDVVAYKSLPRRETHISRLAAIAALYGLEATPPDDCRVLELGCGAGGNLLPMAVEFPRSELIGLDLSSSAIEEGVAAVRSLGLRNIRLENKPIAFRKDLGEFDYIICHGVYSWVSKDVRERILRICEKQLSKRGLAYVSFNALPGWHMKGMLREMMLYHVRGIEEPKERLAQARAVLEFVVSGRSGVEDAYTELVRTGLREIEESPRYYVYHEYLEDHNEAFYFRDFAELLAKHALSYVGDAQLALSALSTLPSDTREAMRELGGDRARIEQYLDFVRNRMLRETILCRRGRSIEFPPSPSRLQSLYLSSAVRSGDGSSRSGAFHGRGGHVSTEDPSTKACLEILGEVWPGRLSFPDLERRAAERAGRATVSSEKLCENLFLCLEANLLEVDSRGGEFTSEVPQRPNATALARLQAMQHDSPTSLRHQAVRLESISRQVLALCDGERNAEEIVDELVAMALRGEIRIEEGKGTVMNEAVIRNTMESVAERALAQLTKHAFFRS